MSNLVCRTRCAVWWGGLGLLLLLSLMLSGCTSGSGPAWQGLGPNGVSILSLAFGPQNTAILFAGSDGQGLFRSPDGGATWQALNTGLLSGKTVRSIVYDPAQSVTYLGTSAGILLSSDNGDHWQNASQGLPTGENTQAGAVNTIILSPDDPTTLYAGTSQQGVFVSHDGAKTWSASNQGLPAGASVQVLLAVGQGQRLRLYAGLAGAGIYQSSDGGANWSASSTGLPPGIDVYSLLYQPSSPGGLYAGTNAGLYYSSKSGASWKAVNTGLGQVPPAVFALALNDQNPQILFAGTSTGVYRSADGGANWGQVAPGLPSGQDVRALVVLGSKSSLGLIFAAAGGIYRYPTQTGSTAGRVVEFVIIGILVAVFFLLFYQQRRLMQRMLPKPPTQPGQQGLSASNRSGILERRGKAGTGDERQKHDTEREKADQDEARLNGAEPKQPD